MNIAFVTSLEDPKLTSDDLLAIPLLKKYGHSVSPLIWEHSSKENLKGIEALIFRSCWNYHRNFLLFRKWLEDLKAIKIPIFNSLEIMKWNLNKKHILELAPDINIPKSSHFKIKKSLTQLELQSLFESSGSHKLVIKPAVSLNGHDTFLFDRDELPKALTKTNELLIDREVLVQEFIPEIQTQGEVSLVYFNHQFSHAVRKIPAAGEFRVHSEYGGKRIAIEASHEARNYAERLLKHLKEQTLFARIDLVEAKTGPVLIELEVTDPMLYLASDSAAPERFARAISEVLA